MSASAVFKNCTINHKMNLPIEQKPKFPNLFLENRNFNHSFTRDHKNQRCCKKKKKNYQTSSTKSFFLPEFRLQLNYSKAVL